MKDQHLCTVLRDGHGAHALSQPDCPGRRCAVEVDRPSRTDGHRVVHEVEGSGEHGDEHVEQQHDNKQEEQVRERPQQVAILVLLVQDAHKERILCAPIDDSVEGEEGEPISTAA